MSGVFVDTSGFYAFLDGTDPFHATAKAEFERTLDQRLPLVTTSSVVHESWAIIQGRLGWEAVDGWLDRIVSSCEIVWVDERLYALGAARCRQARARRLSLTDCVSIEVMRQFGLTRAIADDKHFTREGFSLP